MNRPDRVRRRADRGRPWPPLGRLWAVSGPPLGRVWAVSGPFRAEKAKIREIFSQFSADSLLIFRKNNSLRADISADEASALS